jgi:hypothetical protein
MQNINCVLCYRSKEFSDYRNEYIKLFCSDYRNYNLIIICYDSIHYHIEQAKILHYGDYNRHLYQGVESRKHILLSKNWLKKNCIKKKDVSKITNGTLF